jgi:alkanesulfonate monooxygenase SsuD/methylene tetrahydromethanopterin reductase-like flavin-dependent oxidoreductase (luciferase family)
MEWSSTGEQVRRMEEALEIIDRLLDGERLDHEGRFFRTSEAYLHTRGDGGPRSTRRRSAPTPPAWPRGWRRRVDARRP